SRAVQEVPLPQRPFLTVEDDDALAVQHKEVLLHRLGVIPAVRLAGLHDLDVHAGVRPWRVVGLEVDQGRATRVADRRGRRDVHDEWLFHRATVLGLPRASPGLVRSGTGALVPDGSGAILVAYVVDDAQFDGPAPFSRRQLLRTYCGCASALAADAPPAGCPRPHHWPTP